MTDKRKTHYYLVLLICLFPLISCEMSIDTPKDKIKGAHAGAYDYTVIVSQNENYLFLFDKNLRYGDNTAVLLNRSGEVIADLNERSHMIASAKFFNDSLLLLSLEEKRLLLYNIKQGNSYEVVVDELNKNFLHYDEFYLINSSVAVCVTDRGFGGSNYLGNDLVAIDLEEDEVVSIDKDIISVYKIGDELFYTKGFQFSYKVEADKGIEQCADIGKKALSITSNSLFSAYITWSGLSEKLQELLDQHSEDYSDRLYDLSLLNQWRYDNSYSFEVMNNESQKVILNDTFPKEGYDIQSISFANNSDIVMTLFQRDAPAITRVLVYSIGNNEQQWLPEGSKLLYTSEEYLILSSNEGYLSIYSFLDKKMREVEVVGEMVEQFMSKGSSGSFFYATKNIGKGCSLYRLDMSSGTIQKVKYLTNIELGHPQ